MIWRQRRLLEGGSASKEGNQKGDEYGRQYVQGSCVRRSWVVMGDKVGLVLWYFLVPQFLLCNMEMIIVITTQGRYEH